MHRLPSNTNLPGESRRRRSTIESRLFDHVLGEGSPLPELLSGGKLSAEWIKRYQELLKQADQTWREHDHAPLELLSALRAASWHLGIRYFSHRNFDPNRNEATERQLAEIQAASEALLLALTSHNNHPGSAEAKCSLKYAP